MRDGLGWDQYPPQIKKDMEPRVWLSSFLWSTGTGYITAVAKRTKERAVIQLLPLLTGDIDDNNDASLVMMKVLGDPPPNVIFSTRWIHVEELGENVGGCT
jgi:hypothetical protein